MLRNSGNSRLTKRVAVGGAALTIVLAGLVVQRAVFAQLFPFQSNKDEAIDPGPAFREGYRSYQRGDYPTAIGRLQLASTNFPDLGDYGLYYLAAAQAGSGDQRG